MALTREGIIPVDDESSDNNMLLSRKKVQKRQPPSAPKKSMSDSVFALDHESPFLAVLAQAARATAAAPHKRGEIGRYIAAFNEAYHAVCNKCKSEDDAVVMAKFQAVTLLACEDSDANIRKLGVAMILAGTLLSVLGGLMIAASLGVCATGILAPLAAVPFWLGVSVAALGVGTLVAGVGMFAPKSSVREPDGVVPAPRPAAN